MNGAHLPSYQTALRFQIDTGEQRQCPKLGFTRVEPLSAMEDTGGAWWASAMHEQKGC